MKNESLKHNFKQRQKLSESTEPLVSKMNDGKLPNREPQSNKQPAVAQSQIGKNIQEKNGLC